MQRPAKLLRIVSLRDVPENKVADYLLVALHLQQITSIIIIYKFKAFTSLTSMNIQVQTNRVVFKVDQKQSIIQNLERGFHWTLTLSLKTFSLSQHKEKLEMAI